MKNSILSLLCFTWLVGLTVPGFGQTDILDNASFFSTTYEVNDAVYDETRNVVWATTPSSTGFTLGNRLLMIDPADGSVLDETFVGAEPNQVEISADGSRIYMGIDGAQGMRSFDIATGALGEILALENSHGPAVAEDLAVSPGFPNSIVVSRDTVGSSASGSLEVFADDQSTWDQGFEANNLISFVDENTLFSFNNSNTGFNAKLFEFDGETLTLLSERDGVVSSFNVESEVGRDQRVYFSNGLVLDSSDLSSLGTFNTGLNSIDSNVEGVPALGLTYFAGPASFQTDVVTLNVFDNETFLLMDSIELTGLEINDGRGELIIAGPNTLAIIAASPDSDARVLTFVSNIPVQIAESAVLLERGVTYGGSSFSETEFATDKFPLLPGQTATFANYTSYSKGLNRVAFDIERIGSPELDANDFEFRVGNSDNPADWTLLNSSTTIPLPTISVGTPVDDITPVLLSWPDNAIENAWLQVIVLETDNTNLGSPETFYFGNAIGETGNDASNARVDLVDVGLTRSNQTGITTAPIDNNFDFDRDGRVNLVDVGLCRSNQTGFTTLQLISPPANRNGRSGDSDGKKKGQDSFKRGREKLTAAKIVDGNAKLQIKTNSQVKQR
jgi:hypothetical protein